MTEIEELKEELLQTKLAYLSALQLSQFKGEYLGKIAHELRSPISSLMGLHQLIIGDLCDNPEEEREFVIKAYEYAKKLLGLIDEVIIISQIESGRIELEIKPLKVTEIVAEIHKLTYLQAANRNLKLVVSEIDPNLHILADEKKLVQSIVNLIEVSIPRIEIGKIILHSQKSSSANLIEINLDLPLPLNLWYQTSESNLLIAEKLKDVNKLPQFSPAMRVNLSQQLTEKMGGIFQILEITPNPKDSKLITRLQFLLPMTFPNAEIL